MKKISIALAALILTVCLVSCGSKKTSEEELSSALISAYEAHEAAENETSAITEIIETDPFNGVTITIPETDITSQEIISYPCNFAYNVECSDETVAPIFENDDYDSEIIEETADNFTVKVTIKEDVVIGLEEDQGIRLVPTSKEFTIDVKPYRMNLVSLSQLTPENIDAIFDGMKKHIVADIESENDNIEDWNAFHESINGNNPENQAEITALINTDLTLEKSFIDDIGKENLGEINSVYAIFKNKDNQYFLSGAVPMFFNEKFEDENTEYQTFKYIPEEEIKSYIYFSTIDDAVNTIPIHETTGKPVRELK